MNLPDVATVSPPPDYAVLGLSLTDEVEAQWVTPVAADAMAQVLACERRGLRGVVVELDEHGAVPVEVRKVMARALAQGSSRGARQESKGARDPRAEVGRWLARLLESTSVSAEGAALTSWSTGAAKWAAYFPDLPSSAVRTLAGLTDGAGWDQFRAEASELIDLLRHVDNFYADPSASTTERVRSLSYYTRGFQRLRAACEAAPELRQAAEFYLLQAVRSSQEAAEVAGFVGAESKDIFGWAQDRFGEDSEVMAAAQARAARWRTARELSVADRRRAARWLAQHPSARRETRMIGIWSAQRGPGGPAGGERQVALQAEQESAEAQREARYALWAYLDEYEAELSVPDPVRRGRSRDQWLRHREEAERLAGAAFLSVAHAAADLERVLRAVGAALEAGEKGFMEFASEWRALQAASAALQGLLPADPAETVIPGLGWGKWQRPVPMLYRLVVTTGVPEDGVTSEPLAAVLWWLRRDRPENRVKLSCSDALGQWQALTIRSLLRRIRYVALSTQERAELDGALAVWLLAEGEWHTAGKDWHRMGRRWAEVLSDAPPRASLLTRLRALGHGKTADVTVLQQGAALLGDEEDGGAVGASIPTESGLAIPLDRDPGVSQSVLLESARAGGTCYVHALLPEKVLGN
ncbi:hypothetical protein [Streptomyces sp. NPDC059816]|uniref:hypothetical protein n=1 Tax=Streptomyces sp. NPDC059816 TaxID=3346960 RepID=UPI0036465788